MTDATVVLTELRMLGKGLDHPEGVVWDPDRDILYAGGEAGQVYAFGPDRSMRVVAQTEGFLLGLTIDGDGVLYGCDLGRQEVLRIDPDSGAVDRYSSGTSEEPMRTPNFAAFGPDGSMYVTDSGGWAADDGLIFRVRPGGRTEVASRDAARFPNGCCVSADALSLYVVESLAPGIVRLPIDHDGALGAPELVCELPGSVPDGIAATADGGLVVACYRPDCVYRVFDGQPQVMMEDPTGVMLAAPTNVAFFGEDLRSVAFANLGRWHLTVGSIDVAGAPLHRPRVGA
jgi:gluconolactonase